MKFSHRGFSSETDKFTMMDLALRFPNNNLHVYDLPYRLSSWALNDPENVHLWLDSSNQLVGWAVMQLPWWTIDYAFDPIFETDLHPLILEWAEHRAQEIQKEESDRNCWFACVFSNQVDRIRCLENFGYFNQADVGEDSWSKVHLCRPALTPVKVFQPPPGFIVRPIRGAEETQAYVDLHQSTFGSKNMILEWRNRTIVHPAYRPEIDLVVESPDARLGAFCIGWFDPKTRCGCIEPLGCHQDFRRFALGRVALSHCVEKLHQLGAEKIFVETDNYRDTAYRLYQSLGFELIQDVFVFKKVMSN